MIRTALFEYQIFQLGTNRANFFSIYPRIARHLFEIKRRSQIAFEYQEWLPLSFIKKEIKILTNRQPSTDD